MAASSCGRIHGLAIMKAKTLKGRLRVVLNSERIDLLSRQNLSFVGIIT